MNLVERWFAELTNKWLRRGTHTSVKELTDLCQRMNRNLQPQPPPLQMAQNRRRNLRTHATIPTTTPQHTNPTNNKHTKPTDFQDQNTRSTCPACGGGFFGECLPDRLRLCGVARSKRDASPLGVSSRCGDVSRYVCVSRSRSASGAG